MITRIPVTLDNFASILPQVAHALTTVPLIGLDIETEDSRRHPGLKAYNGKGKKLVFDVNRTRLCGLSLWPDNSAEAWYFNLGHADIEGRIPWSALQPLLNLKPTTSKWVVHNANFERTMLHQTVGWDITDYICTLVMAVSAYSPDEYDLGVFQERGLGGIERLLTEVIQACRAMQETPETQELLSKVIAKESDAEHSYNGYVKDMSYGYGLKQAVQAWFNYQMKTFEETLKGYEHMGELTTAQVADYGCDDAIWCVKLYHRLLKFMMDTNPTVISTCFTQELPMVEVYSECWRTGVRINSAAVDAKQLELRATYAARTRALKVLVRKLLPFPVEPHEGLMEYEKWYRANHARYRASISSWANSADSDDPFVQATQLSGAIPNAWSEEKGVVVPKGLNLTHYMPMRVLMYDLFRRERLIVVKGKVQSDAWARGRLQESLGEGDAASVMKAIGELATIEQASKLYITPYKALLDPETSRLYPVMGSELATRRTAMSTPNAQQLAKRGESVYVRGFYQADGPFGEPSKFAKRDYADV